MGTRLKLKVQLYCGAEIALGPGKADLLDAIAATGSISAAARDMGMSYRRAWLLVDTMNRCFAQKLVETQAGGGKASGARLSDLGVEVLAQYRALYRALSKCVEEGAVGPAFAIIEAALREEPLPPS